jgi:hypothetical protein
MEATETKIEHKLMTLEEQADIMYKAVMLRKKGEEEEALRLIKSVPLPPYLAKIGKEVYGADFLVEYGYNLLEADEAYGKDWLYK